MRYSHKISETSSSLSLSYLRLEGRTSSFESSVFFFYLGTASDAIENKISMSRALLFSYLNLADLHSTCL